MKRPEIPGARAPIELPPGAAIIGLAEGPLDQLRANAPELHAHEGPFHEWLLARFPEGSGGREVFVRRRDGTEDVPREAWDFTPDPGETVVVFVAPGEPISGTALLTSILISIAVSVVMTVAMALLFPQPEQPSFAKARKPSAVYSTAFPQNTARLHEPLPVLYGYQAWAPDLAAMPYSYFADNKHYVVVLLLLTCGECDVEGVFAGATNVESLPEGSVRWKAYGPKDHVQRHGVIGADFGIWEDVITSVDVTGVELKSSTRDQTHKLDATFIAPDTIRLFATGAAVDAFEEEGSIIVSGTSSNNGAFTIDRIQRGANRTDLDVGSGIVDETGGSDLLRIFDGSKARRQGNVQVWYFSETSPGGSLGLSTGDLVRVTAGGVDQYGTVERYYYRIDYEGDDGAGDGGLHTLRLKNVGGALKNGSWSSATVYTTTSAATFDTSGIPRWTGPFQVAKTGQAVSRIEVDLEFPGGLYKADESSGELLEATATFRFQVQALDADGNPTGDWKNSDLSVSTTDHLAAGEPLNTPIRLTHVIDVAAGEWRIRGRRISPTSTSAADQSRSIWSQLKGRRVLQDPSRAVYGPVTILALEAEATAGLSREAIGRIRVAATRRLPRIRTPYDGDGLGRSRSPARAVYDMLTNPHYGLGYDPARIFDLGDLRDARVLHASIGATFDHLLTDQMSGREAVRLALQPALADMQVYNGKVVVRQEGPKAERTLLFSPQNVIAGTPRFTFGFRSPGDPDGIRIVTLDPDSLSEGAVVWPATAERPTEQKIYGMQPGFAEDYAKVRWRQRRSGRLVAQFSVRGESRLARAGERVGLAWPVFGWGDAARLVAVEETEDGFVLTLDRPVPDIDGGIPWTQLRSADGRAVGPVAMTVSGPKTITLPGDPGIALHVLGGGQEPTHVAIGEGQDFLLDLIVETVEMDGPGRGKITARLYLPSAYEGTVFEGLAS